MRPTYAKPIGAPDRAPDHRASDAVPATTPGGRRAALEAQKRYMDERFGRDRSMNRRKPSV